MSNMTLNQNIDVYHVESSIKHANMAFQLYPKCVYTPAIASAVEIVSESW